MLFEIVLAQEEINIDSIISEYGKSVLQMPDSVLFLGEVTVEWWGKDGGNYVADSGVDLSFQAGARYISVQTEKYGLFHFVVAKDEMPVHSIGVWYDTILISMPAWRYEVSPFFGVGFISGITESSSEFWKVAYSENLVKILEDFVLLYPSNNFCPQARALSADLELATQIENRLNSHSFESAKGLLLEMVKLRTSSRFMGLILGELALRWAEVVFEMGDTMTAINILKGFITLGNLSGDIGKISNSYIVSTLIRIEIGGHFSRSEILDYIVNTEVAAHFLSNIISEKEVYLFKYNAYARAGNYEKIKEICRARLKRYPYDSLGYEHIINCHTNTDSAINLCKEAIKKHVPISDGTIARIGFVCYTENKFKEAVYFFEKVKDFTIKFGLYYFNCYVKALTRIGKTEQAKQHFLHVLTTKTSKDTLSHLDYHYLIEDAIVLKMDDVAEQLYSMAQTKLNPHALLYLRISMSKWYCENTEKEKALKVLKEVLSDTVKPQIYKAMGDCYKNFADYDSAEICYMKAINMMDRDWSKLEAILSLSEVYLKTNNKCKIVAILNDFLKDIKDHTDYVDKIKGWCNDKYANDIMDRLLLPGKTIEE